MRFVAFLVNGGSAAKHATCVMGLAGVMALGGCSEQAARIGEAGQGYNATSGASRQSANTPATINYYAAEASPVSNRRQTLTRGELPPLAGQETVPAQAAAAPAASRYAARQDMSAPDTRASVPPAGRTAAPQGMQITVASRDTLFGLGQRYGVSVDAIVAANNLTTRNIRPGQRLVIPAATPRGNVAPRQQTASADPRSVPRAPRAEAAPSRPAAEACDNCYQSRPGDSLFSIARHYNMAPGYLAHYNRLPVSAPLRPGQVLRIPGHIVPQASAAPVETTPLRFAAATQSMSDASPVGAQAQAAGDAPVKMADAYTGRREESWLSERDARDAMRNPEQLDGPPPERDVPGARYEGERRGAPDTRYAPETGYATDTRHAPDTRYAPGRRYPPERGAAPDTRHAPDARHAPDQQDVPDERYAPDRRDRRSGLDKRPAPAAKPASTARSAPPAATPTVAPAQAPAAADTAPAQHANAAPTAPAAPAATEELRQCDDVLANPLPRSGQTFRQPVEGMVISKFGQRPDGTMNDGIDFAVPKGTPVKAAENGVVAYVGTEISGLGKLVLVRHADDYVSAYAHNDDVLVKRCDIVKRGQVIAKAGASGSVSKPQLHFELRKNSKPVDPQLSFAGTQEK